MTLYEILLVFFIYGFLGWCTEVAFAAVKQKKFVNRGFLNGPLCPIYGIGVITVVVILEPYTGNLVALYFLSALLVTALEWVTGILLEKIFHHKWWDYSEVPMNIGGYVCIPFSIIWGAACVVIVKCIHPLVYKLVSLIPVWLDMILLAIMCVLLIADVCVTVAGILNLNHRLNKMKELAEELHRLSDQIGENIYQNMMDGLEKQEQAKKKTEELKQKYEEMLESQSRTGRRLLKAFPNLNSKDHEEQIKELKARFEKKNRWK